MLSVDHSGRWVGHLTYLSDQSGHFRSILECSGRSSGRQSVQVLFIFSIDSLFRSKIFFCFSWPVCVLIESQPTIDRLGQTRDVVVYRLMTCSSIEEKIYRKQVFKGSLIKKVMEKHDPYRYFTSQEIAAVLSLDDPRVSETQIQLESLHAAQRIASPALQRHMQFLTDQTNVFGLSDHNLLFSNCLHSSPVLSPIQRKVEEAVGRVCPDSVSIFFFHFFIFSFFIFFFLRSSGSNHLNVQRTNTPNLGTKSTPISPALRKEHSSLPRKQNVLQRKKTPRRHGCLQRVRLLGRETSVMRGYTMKWLGCNEEYFDQLAIFRMLTFVVTTTLLNLRTSISDSFLSLIFFPIVFISHPNTFLLKIAIGITGREKTLFGPFF